MPSNFFNKTCARDVLAQVACVSDEENVSWVEIPEYGAFLVWAEPARCVEESAGPEDSVRPEDSAPPTTAAASAESTPSASAESVSADPTAAFAVESATRNLPEMYFILKDLPKCLDYNKIFCTWAEGYLYLAIAQGRTLLLANTYPAGDFATVQYYIFLSLKSLQLNPEISTVCFRSPLSKEDEMSMYRYFKAVEILCA